jgi:phosphatidylglycerophosphatase A
METTPQTKTRRPIWWYIATWFGSGLSPFASGTAGSAAALPFAWVIQKGFGAYFGNIVFGNVALFIASILIFFIGWWASIQYLNANPGNTDPGEIVVDEVAGQWLLLSVLFPTWHSYFVGFLLFRIFDVVKPWPVSWADQKIGGGLGVMFDDMLAALYPILVFLAIMIESQLFHGQKIFLPILHFLGGHYVQ